MNWEDTGWDTCGFRGLAWALALDPWGNVGSQGLPLELWGKAWLLAPPPRPVRPHGSPQGPLTRGGKWGDGPSGWGSAHTRGRHGVEIRQKGFKERVKPTPAVPAHCRGLASDPAPDPALRSLPPAPVSRLPSRVRAHTARGRPRPQGGWGEEGPGHGRDGSGDPDTPWRRPERAAWAPGADGTRPGREGGACRAGEQRLGPCRRAWHLAV